MRLHLVVGSLLGLALASGSAAAWAAPWHVRSDGESAAHSHGSFHADGADRAAHDNFWRASPAPMVADREHRDFHGGDHAPVHGPYRHDWGHGDLGHFYDRDFDDWHHGYWHRGWDGDRFGWWWIVSGVWFFYSAPVYPYPDPYVPYGFVTPPPPPGTVQPATQYWYFCPAANGYYPYVASCPSGWQQVPAQPQPAADVPGPPGG